MAEVMSEISTKNSAGLNNSLDMGMNKAISGKDVTGDQQYP